MSTQITDKSRELHIHFSLIPAGEYREQIMWRHMRLGALYTAGWAFGCQQGGRKRDLILHTQPMGSMMPLSTIQQCEYYVNLDSENCTTK